MGRKATRTRRTSESTVEVTVDLDGTGVSRVSTGIGFYDHMLTSLSKHSLIDLDIEATGDLHVDAHHTVEDVAIVLGEYTIASLLGRSVLQTALVEVSQTDPFAAVIVSLLALGFAFVMLLIVGATASTTGRKRS